MERSFVVQGREIGNDLISSSSNTLIRMSVFIILDTMVNDIENMLNFILVGKR